MKKISHLEMAFNLADGEERKHLEILLGNAYYRLNSKVLDINLSYITKKSNV